jgi:hypothetical protein
LPYKYHPTPVSKGRENKRKTQKKNENTGENRTNRREERTNRNIGKEGKA